MGNKFDCGRREEKQEFCDWKTTTSELYLSRCRFYVPHTGTVGQSCVVVADRFIKPFKESFILFFFYLNFFVFPSVFWNSLSCISLKFFSFVIPVFVDYYYSWNLMIKTRRIDTLDRWFLYIPCGIYQKRRGTSPKTKNKQKHGHTHTQKTQNVLFFFFF